MKFALIFGVVGQDTVYLLKLLLKKINYKYMILDKSKPDGTKRKIIDNSLALSYVWKPKINLDDAFELTLKSYFSNSNK
jgi:GDP-L-fucose synthase